MDTLEIPPPRVGPGTRVAELRGASAVVVDPELSVQRGAELLRAAGAAYLVVVSGEQVEVLAGADVLLAAGVVAGQPRPRREAVSVLGEHAEIWLG